MCWASMGAAAWDSLLGLARLCRGDQAPHLGVRPQAAESYSNDSVRTALCLCAAHFLLGAGLGMEGQVCRNRGQDLGVPRALGTALTNMF